VRIDGVPTARLSDWRGPPIEIATSAVSVQLSIPGKGDPGSMLRASGISEQILLIQICCLAARLPLSDQLGAIDCRGHTHRFED
jgi:hypothetical protein